MTQSETKPMSVVHVRKGEATVVPGRRSFIQYLALGAAEGSNGTMRAEILLARPEGTQPTGWHYHDCQVQFLYMLKGAIELQFPGGDWIRLAEGDSITIPGGTVHQERGGSDMCEVMEVSVPAKMETVAVNLPDALI